MTLPRFLLLLSCCLATLGLQAQPEQPEAFASLNYRPIGPLNMSGRVADVEGIPGNPDVLYVGSASGGVWKTTDGGITFKPIFDDQPIQSIGDMALAPSNRAVIYVGSGESNVRNSVSFGNGVYRSNDAGATWQHIGLKDTRHISRVMVHPQNPDWVYVAAVGHIYGPNENRGVFRSKDGGENWEKVLYIDEMHGAADIDMSPGNPNVLFAGMWHFQRNPWDHDSGSENGGVYKSTDGGESWTKITKGLPKLMGRIGVKVAPSNPDVVYVIAESNEGVLFRSDDGGESFRKVNDDVGIVSRGFYYTDLRVDPQNEDRVYSVASRLWRSIDGGKNFETFSQSTHVDYHSLWIDPEDPSRMWQGQDGGIAVSYNAGDSWEPIRNLPLAQFYQIYVDDREPFYYTGGGLQDNGTWIGPSRTKEFAGILPDLWNMISFGDAYFVVPHPDDPNIIISESQAGGIVKSDVNTMRQADISPQPRRNDGGPVGELTYRFNWNAPIIQSPHDPMTVYFAGNVVFKSTDFGESWSIISPDLTTDDPEKQGNAGGPVWNENTTAEYHCTIISFAESSVDSGLYWSGSDDGKLYLSRDGGDNWQDLTSNLPGLPANSPVSHLEPSRVAAGTAYAAFDRHMFNDLRAHVFKTEDFGASWVNISGNLPEGAYVWVVREDPRNPNLIYAGTEIGLYATHTGGQNWYPVKLGNLPAVAVHDIIVHPRENDLLLGTHGRGIFILDDATPIQDWPKVDQDQPLHLFPIRDAMRFPRGFSRYGLGDKVKVMPNPPTGAIINFYMKGPDKQADASDEKAEKKGKRRKAKKDADKPAEEQVQADKQQAPPKLKVEILAGDGQVIRTLKRVRAKPGLNRISWDLRLDPPRPRRAGDSDPLAFFFGPSGGAYVVPGSYRVRLTLGDTVVEQPVEVTIDPTLDFAVDVAADVQSMVMQLNDMRSGINDALRGLDTISGQLTDREKTLKQLKREQSEELAEAWKTYTEEHKTLLERLERPEGKTYWSQSPQLSDLVSGLSRSLDGAFQAPTAAQQDFFKELVEAYDAFVVDINAYFTTTGQAFNQQLEKDGIAPIMLPNTVPDEAASANTTTEGDSSEEP